VIDTGGESDAAVPPTPAQIEHPLFWALFQHVEVAAIPLPDVAATTRHGAFEVEVIQAMILKLIDV
jgi:hypothetical protein